MRKPLISLFAGVLITCLSLFAAAQDVLYEQITEEDNLPSNTVYDILQDDEGYIWLSTDFGVVKYDGFTIETINLPDELKDISIIRLYKDINGRIWFLNFSGTLSYYEDDTVKMAYRLNDLVAPYVKNYIDHIYVDSTGRTWIAPQSGGVYVVDSSGISEYHGKPKLDSIKYCEFRSDRDGQWISIVDRSHTLGEYVNSSLSHKSEYIKCPVITFGSYRHVVMKGNERFLALGKRLYRVIDGRIVDSLSFSNNIASIYLDKNRGLWVSELFNGVYFYDGASFESKPERYFEGTTISRIFRDWEGNYWFTSTQDGVFLVHDLDVRVYPINERSIRYHVITLEDHGNRIYLSTYDQQLFYLNKKSGRIKRLRLDSMNNYAYDIHIDHYNNLWIASSNSLCYTMDGMPNPPEKASPAYLFHMLPDSTLVLASTHLQFYKDRSFISSTSPEPKIRIHAVEGDEKDELWLGTRSGLYVYRNDTFHKIDKPSRLSDLRILSLERLADKLLIGTSSQGLLIWDQDHDTLYSPDISSLQKSSVRAIMPVNDSLFFLGTNKGLYKLSLKMNDGSCQLLYHLHDKNGLPSNVISDLCYDGEKLWIGTQRGLCSIDPALGRQESMLPVFRLENFIVNGVPISMQDSIVLDPGQKNLRIEFHGITFRGASNLNYRYYLAGHDPEIIYTDNKYVTYSNLAAGHYTFYLNAGDIDNNFHSRPLSINITIKKHFTNTLGFIIFITIISLLLIGTLSYLVFKVIHFRSVIRHDLLVTRHQLLRAQMNPHFLFNSLLAVQSFIYKNNPAEAARYLSNFSKLMRLTLNSSRKEQVTLEKEIEFLRNYLDLQKLRFGGKFDYVIEMHEAIDPEKIAIPPLLAQPFIENAVEHGIRNIDYKGLITIRYMLDNGELGYEIEDNGVGLFDDAPATGEEPGEEPVGIRITKERIRLLRKISGRKFVFSIESLRDENNEKRGTRVSFNIQYTIV